MKRRFPAYLLKLLLDPRVSRKKKLAFPLIIVAYWILPDILPFLPMDDLLFTVLMTYWFTRSAERDVPEGPNQRPGTKTGTKTGTGKYIDVDATVLEDEDMGSGTT